MFSFGKRAILIACLTLAPAASFAAQLIVSWDDNSTNETGFKIERSTDGVTFVGIGTVGANVITFTDTTVANSTTYSYRVAAYDATTTSAYSNVTSATTVAAPVSPTISAPTTPTTTPASTPAVTVAPAATPMAPTSRLVNLSVRAVPGPDDRALLVGFVVNSGSKSMLVRAIGPGLSTYTDAVVFQDPKLTIYDGGTAIISNDNWGGAETLKSNFARLGAFPLPDASKDAVVLTNLAPKGYTANISGSGTGLAMAEIYDADTAAQPAGRLVNLSARAHAGPGEGVLIIGFVISGDAPMRVLVRAIGPTLANYGVTTALSDPQLDVYQGSTLVQHNDNWSGSSDLTAAFTKTGAFALPDPASKDAAMIVTLQPGAYTAIVSGVAGADGIALAEVYELR